VAQLESDHQKYAGLAPEGCRSIRDAVASLARREVPPPSAEELTYLANKLEVELQLHHPSVAALLFSPMVDESLPMKMLGIGEGASGTTGVTSGSTAGATITPGNCVHPAGGSP
jgi:hypothetical protein